VPARIPIGVPTATASVPIIRLPKIALRRPPISPGGGVDSVKMARSIPENPSYSSVPRMTASHPRPNRVAATERPRKIALRMRRRR
jgi:hypothetical protein